MNYRVVVDYKKLSNILFTLSAFSKGKLRFYDDTTHTYRSKGTENAPFCRILARSPHSNALCTQCNEQANNRCKNINGCHVYHCHANLLEFVFPIRCNGIYIGHLSTGQFREKSKAPNDTYFNYLAELTGHSTEKIKKAYYSQASLSSDGILGAKLLLELAGQKLNEEQVFSIDTHNIIVQIEQYIRNHLAHKLTLQEIADYVHMNPSYMSSMYHNATGTTISNFIQQERVAQAAYLFSISDMGISKAAAAVGINDANYFTKIFKKQTGYTPRDYRRKITTGEIIY